MQLLLYLLDGLLSGSGATVPARPLLKPWYRLAETGDGMLVEHGGTVVALGGRASRLLLPILLPLLDGSRTCEEVAACVGPTVAPAVEHALQVLGSHGLLTDGPALDPEGAVVATAHRLAAASGDGPAAVAERLRSAQVGFVGPADRTEPVARLLRRSGVEAHADPDGRELTVAVGLPPAELAALNLDLHAARSPWLPVGAFDGRLAEVGPLVVPGETACAECVRIRRRSASGCARDQAELSAVPPAAVAPPTIDALLAALVADDVVRWLGLRDPSLPGSLTTVELSPAPVVSRRHVLRVPRCPACSPGAGLAPPAPWYEADAA